MSETIGQIKQRHKLELRTLQNDVKAFQKKAKKERMDKKEIELQSNKMMEDVKNRQESELAEAQGDEPETVEEDDSESSEHASKPVELTRRGVEKVSKAMRRRENKKRQERERQERIDEANKDIVDERQIEVDAIQAKLQPIGLKIKEVTPDGHCMYHAVADQLQQKHYTFDLTDEPPYKQLRRLTGGYMKSHPDDFAPFLALDDDPTKDPTDLFTQYCERVIETSDWGGQLELRALANALERPIQVFSNDTGIVTMGEEFEKDRLHVTYHQNYYSLGEHYNSVEPME